MSKMNAMELHNVHGDPDVGNGDDITEFCVHPTIAKVIWELALKNPMWQFHGMHGSRQNERTKYAYTSFKVKLNNKELGHIGRGHNARGAVVIVVSCKRIADNMARGSAYQTIDPAKAIAKVRKEFVPKTYAERLAEAMEEARNRSRRVSIDTHSEHRRVTDTIKKNVLDYFLTGPGMEEYTAYLGRTNNTEAMNSIRKADELNSELATIEAVTDKIGTSSTALVVLDEGKYLVKILSDMQLHDDTTLPQDLRGKLGLLKLVQPNQFVSSAGFRASEEVFVINLKAN